MFEAEVARGAAWLDARSSGWERRVDLGRLDLTDCGECVLGHVFGGYYTGLNQAGYDFDPVRHGFALPLDTPRTTWQSLTDTWAALIKERFDSGNLSDEQGTE